MKYAFSVMLLSLLPVVTNAGLINPKCDPKKLVDGVTSRVGNRCTLDETIADTTKETLGIDHRVNPKKRMEKKGLIKDKK
ncbi:hypothetical protein ACOMICROBIO_NCLOACGD_05298 [Vibrio sp. B1ASS3]|uniref:hypothetical protein n=1 Tax=Vibrio TaxID=662 RepID=UPI0003A4B646|nr:MULTISPECIES: hypothetical protein [Vibrio]CAD7827316.1 hypothetical protein ACOMICROBIO_NCLOACGD_05298 [Vibrio sp. B1ASS3]CAE6964051.1 hypothetical protein ACOMICROBIO_NCLOACGD_05298 [Vibrio sp. B1ASS3]